MSTVTDYDNNTEEWCDPCSIARDVCGHPYSTNAVAPVVALHSRPNIEDIEDASDHSSEIAWPDPKTAADEPLPQLPPELRDSALGAIASTVAASLQVPIDFTYLTALGVTSAATRNAYTVEVDGAIGHLEALSIYALPILSSGSNKTSSMGLIADPLRQWDRDRLDAYRDSGGRYDLELATAHLERLRSDMKRSTSGKEKTRSDLEIRAELEAATMRVAELEPPESMLVDDTTPEALVDKMVRVGPVALIASEGGFIANLAGRYSNDANLDGALKAHDGKESISVERKGTRQVRVDHPFLSLVLGVQPNVLTEIRDNPQMMGRGFLARFLITVPDSLLGRRTKGAPELREDTRRSWDRTIRALLDNSSEPRVVPLSPEARRLFTEYRYDELEPRLDSHHGDLGATDGLRAWASKLPGQLVRVAALHALVEDPKARELTADQLTRALTASDYFIEHARRAHGPRNASRAQLLLSWLSTHFEDIEDVSDGRRTFSTRAVYQKIRGQAWVKRAEDVRTVLENLADLGWIRPDEPDRTGPGRPSELWIAHPSLTHERNPQ